ncbi:30S ribosomal protein S20 [Candidatus Parcubacteria bacterium]|nr:30S ribosomal protein S20 [Candidatus Parcubacteria bacterium]
MAITKSAKKEIRASEKKAVFNLRRKRTMKAAIKEIDELLKENKIDEAQKKLSEAYKAIDKAAKMNTIKKNTASRTKSRLSAKIKKAKTTK